jgi:hypothetical protein
MIGLLLKKAAKYFSAWRKPSSSRENQQLSLDRDPLPPGQKPFDDSDMAPTRLVSDPANLRFTHEGLARGHANMPQRLAWPARDAAAKSRRISPDHGRGDVNRPEAAISAGADRAGSVSGLVYDSAQSGTQAKPFPAQPAASALTPAVGDDATILVSSRRKPRR